jgi:hypothetical protein
VRLYSIFFTKKKEKKRSEERKKETKEKKTETTRNKRKERYQHKQVDETYDSQNLISQDLLVIRIAEFLE